MPTKVVLVLMATVFASCNSTVDKSSSAEDMSNMEKMLKSSDYTFVSKKDSIFPEIKPMMIKGYYSKLNIIIDPSTSKVFYHVYDPEGRLCGTGLDLRLPYFIDLAPKKLIEIQNDSLIRLIRQHIDDISVTYVVCNDSLNEKQNEILRTIKTESKLNPIQRKLTEEEAFVLKYKLNGKEYVPAKMAWTNPNMRHLGEGK